MQPDRPELLLQVRLVQQDRQARLDQMVTLVQPVLQVLLELRALMATLARPDLLEQQVQPVLPARLAVGLLLMAVFITMQLKLQRLQLQTLLFN